MTLDALLARLRRDNRQRLRWRILRVFGMPPGSREERRLRDVDCLLCGLHLLLDMEERGGSENQAYNPSFDLGQFRRRLGGAE